MPFRPAEESTRDHDLLRALQVALDAAVDTHAHLLPALATVLASSQGHADRVALLREFGLLQLDDFLVRYFSNNTNADSLSWASQVMDLWVSVVPTVRPSRELLDTILGCVEDSSDAVHCYITLQGDECPPERDAAILQRCLERMES